MTSLANTSGPTIAELLSLLKPRVMTLVVFTGAVGMWLAPGHLHPFLQLLTIFSIALGSGAGGVINMWYDRDIDAVMRRTAHRPIPRGTVQADDALVIGVILSITAVTLLGLATNWLAGGLLGFAIFFYAVIYTMALKRRTPQNIVIGGAAGAFPPLIGWAAMSGGLTLEPLLLFGIIFLWTPPHFWALALFKEEDYARAGVPMLPVTHGKVATARQMMAYSVALVTFTLLPGLLGFSGWVYSLLAFGLGGYLLLLNAAVCRRPHEARPARRMFVYSILYLFALFGALLGEHWLYPHLPAIG